MSTFEWRSNDDSSSTGCFDTGDGCLFTCDPAGAASPPALTLLPPAEEKKKDDEDWNMLDNNSTVSIQPAPGDDLSPPNAVQANKMNGIAVPVSASAGWSKSPPKQEGVYPSAVAYDLHLKTNSATATTTPADSLELAVSLEYTNPHFLEGESMMVQVAMAKTLVQAETGAALALVATQFQEFMPSKNQWVDITADVDYTQTAKAVVDAVMADPNAGQTAGKATVTAETIELTLGPFSAKARLNLTFQVEQLYTYDAMSVQVDASDIGSHRLLPLWVTLPFAPTDSEAGVSELSVRFQAPSGTSVMPMDQYQEAYRDLKNQDAMKTSTVLAVSQLVQETQDPPPQQQSNDAATVGYQFHWDSLPPRSCGILAWLALPNPVANDDSGFDFVHIGRSLQDLSGSSVQLNNNSTKAQAVLQIPSAADMASLQVPLPGHGPIGSLWRLKVKMPEAELRQKPCFVLNLTLSDKSGSTGRKVGATTMRQRFNELAEVRFLRRLESIPALVQAGVLRMGDVWMDVFLAFDSAAPSTSIHRVIFRVEDVCDSIVEVVQSIRNDGGVASFKLPSIFQHVQALRLVKPAGLTDFAVGPRTLVHEYGQWQSEAQSLATEKMEPCTFVEFDTDGGHNRSGNYLQSLERLCEVYHVRNGVVTGFGSWLNQDCASKVARTLGSVPAQLSLQVPELGTEGCDKVFRRGFSAWVSALRQPPNVSVKISAGSVSFPSFPSTRNANAVEVLALRRTGERHERLPKFGAPDISNETYTKTVIEGAPAGDEIILYVASRLENASQLVGALEIETSVEGGAAPSKASVGAGAEESTRGFLGFDWLTMLTGKSGANGFQLGPLMSTSLGSRFEDEVSFRFNIASPSGKTSYLGRCKTVANRASIDAAHQPAPPASPLKVPTPKPTAKPTYCKLSMHSGGPSRGASAGMAQQRRGMMAFSSSPGMPPPPGAPIMAMPGFSGSVSSSRPTFHASPMLACDSTFANEVTRSVGYSGFKSSSGSTKRAHLNVENRKMASSAKRAQTAPARSRQPSWMDALTVPVGCSLPLPKQDYDDLKQAMAAVAHARQRLLGDVSVNFICDICNRRFSAGEDRFHCFDCKDFDSCAGCKDGHKLPFHRMSLISPSALPASIRAAQVAMPEDPLVDMLLKPPPTDSLPTAVATLEPQPPNVDQTLVWCENQVRRFLLAVLHWWPLIRATCVFRDRLPAAVADDVADKISRCCGGEYSCCSSTSNNNLDEMLITLSLVLDSLVREDTKSQAQSAHGEPVTH